MKKIKLSSGQYTLVDDDDYEYLSRWSWQCTKGRAMRSMWLKDSYGKWTKRRTIYMHREVMKANNNQWIDHMNGNPLDNRKGNLRFATRSQNAQNAKTRKDNKAGYKGVCWRDKHRDFVVYINVNGKRICLKTYKTLENAIEARKRAELYYHGEFALAARGGCEN